ncbi:EAL domain, c-di-GMP-specific phosphodiesterase class I (or its enzymatically inactive variant) [Devosia enhydra]|uniref:EAL domain, c-di-GMP-specific phosphodiesterase class I (Or its enzymatically inactive variant) n=1 Tax=Devosia enhydra TaxID=665118 RepID=A0A1K2HU73_9HYPH|nr:EAL domain-containing protein [Devosia enhydra]SFZ81912.1 EAL domain, c-di-GMP-specific phosphodiesterase class I (or its enzymatically inactive variant) [Devosia enhydra]
MYDTVSDRLVLIESRPGSLAVVGERANPLGLDWLGMEAGDLASLARVAPSHIAVDIDGGDPETVLQSVAQAASAAMVMLVGKCDPERADRLERLAFELGLAVIGGCVARTDVDAIDGFLSLQGMPPAAAEAGLAPGSGLSLRDVDLAAALTDGQLFIVLHPRIGCCDGRLDGFEALLRWHHPELGALSAAQFIEQAERLGLQESVTDFVLGESLGWLARSRAAGATMSVNLSMGSLAEPDLCERVLHHCDRHEVSPSRLTLEVQAQPGHLGEASLAAMARMRSHGVRFALDDFDVSEMSLGQLVRLPIDDVKLDRQTIGAATGSEETRRLIVATVAAARALGLRTVAEGVETLETLTLLRSAGCDLAQGYFISRPMLPPAALAWMGAAA